MSTAALHMTAAGTVFCLDEIRAIRLQENMRLEISLAKNKHVDWLIEHDRHVSQEWGGFGVFRSVSAMFSALRNVGES
ncbi:hypothetical protein AC629_41790 [Bradyrhizobium sp. NAS80.1]|nr:hypothetical protein AC629_41790 [Bradyrhizobium sp. NAS80.1]